MPRDDSRIIKLDRNFQLLGAASEVSLQVVPPSNAPEIAQVILQNAPFPEKPIEFGKLSIRAGSGRDIQFTNGKGLVSFAGQGGAFAGLGLYLSPDQLLDDLGLEQSIAPGVKLEQSPNSYFMSLRWGYDLNASGKGSVALGGPGAVSFAVDGKREGLYAVIRRLDKNTGARTALTETVNSWVLPSHLSSANLLSPGTWLITQVDGAIALKLGARYGFDFNWIRAAELGGIRGDVGLRLQLGIAASLGFQCCGSYALVIGRESADPTQQRIRLRLFKQRKKGWDFAFNSGTTVQADLKDLVPSSFDDFVKAVLGIHGVQILEGLTQWSDPRQSPSGALAGVSVKYGLSLIQELTGLDPVESFNEAVAPLKNLLQTWNHLDHRLASMLWKLIDEKADLAPVRSLAWQIAQGNLDSVKELLNQQLQRADFFTTPSGKFLGSAAVDGLLRAVSGTREFQALQQAAKLTGEVLDEGTTERLLHRFQQIIAQRLDLKQIENVVDRATFENLDEWLKARLTSFLGDNLDLAKLETVRKTIHLLQDKGQEFYTKALRALTRKYEVEFSTAYQQTTTQNALLDVLFDFATPGTAELFLQAVEGHFEDLLMQEHKGVDLNLGALTHQIARHSHVEISLPFFDAPVDHINEALARADVVEEQDGKLLVYELEAQDIVASGNARNSRLAIGGYLPTRFGSGARVHSTESLSYGYSFRQVRRSMQRADLQYQLKPYVDAYFPKAFASREDDGDGQSFVTFIGDLDKAIDQIEYNGTNNFGNTLVALDFALPAAAAASWLAAPLDRKAPQYMEMSRRLQRKMRQLIPFFYFQDASRYQNLVSAAVLLIYASMPVSTAVRQSGSELAFNTDADLYWDWMSETLRKSVVFSSEATISLASQMERVSSYLRAIPGLSGLANFYDPKETSTLLQYATRDPGTSLLNSLLYVESDIITGARDAGVALANYLEQSLATPAHLLETLAQFGSKITETFNRKVTSVYGGDALRPLGTMVFIEAAAALNPALAGSPVSAALELIVIRKDSKFPMVSYLEGGMPSEQDVVIRHHVVNL